MDGEIGASAVADLLKEGDIGLGSDLRIVDIRPTSEFRRGHIPGSESIPFGDLHQEVDRLAGATQVITVCPHGAASVGAARLIDGYEGLAPDATVKSMAGGLAAWSGPLESGPELAESEQDDAPF